MVRDSFPLLFKVNIKDLSLGFHLLIDEAKKIVSLAVVLLGSDSISMQTWLKASFETNKKVVATMNPFMVISFDKVK